MSLKTEELQRGLAAYKQKKRQDTIHFIFLCALGIFLFLLVWQMIVVFQLVNVRNLPSPVEVFETLVYKISNKNPDGNTLGTNIAASIQVALSGFFLAAVIGVPLGLLMGWFTPMDRFVRPVFELLRPVPPIAWIPVVVVFVGIDLKAKAVIIFLSVFVPCVINSYTGIRLTSRTLINVAKTFNETVGVDGVILTKLDGDTRGGAALSIRAVTGKPILYVGMGEKLSDLEQFYPDRMASRILGMGDVLSLIEKAEASIDKDEARDLGRKLKKAEFGYDDFLKSMGQIKKMGNLTDILNMIPGMNSKALKNVDIDDSQTKRVEAIILSMTPQERANPDLMNPSRKNRIARGAGVDVSEVNKLVKQFEQMRKMMKQFSGQLTGKGAKRGRFKLPF